MTATEEFLRALFQGTRGFIALTTYKRSWLFPTTDDGIEKAALQAVAVGAKEDLLFGCASRQELPPGPKYGTKKQCVDAKAVWADIDFGTIGHAAKNCPPTYEDARALIIEAGLPVPTFVVHTGGGLHAYWVLLDAIPASEIEPLNQLVQGRIRAKAEAHGWHTDMHDSWQGVLRVPGGYNHKKGRALRLVELVEENEVVYTPISFTGSVAASDTSNGIQPPVTDNPARHPVESCAESEATTKPVPSGPAMPLEKIRERLRAIRNPEISDLVRTLLSEKAFTAGERNTSLIRLAGLVADIAPFNDPKDLLKLFAGSIAAMGNPDDFETVRDMLVRTQEKSLENLAQDIELAESFVAQNSFNGTTIRTRPAYTEKELASFAKKLGVDRDELNRRWIIKGKKIHFFLVDGKYAQRPVGLEDLAVQMRTVLAPSPIQWTKFANNEVVDRKPDEIMSKHASVFTHLVSDLALQEHRYDGETQTFYEAVCPLRKLGPRYDENIDAWLRALGGEKQEKLLDWLASVTKLDQQSCALYIAATASIGKSLLARGIAQLWKPEGVPTELGPATSSFNSDIARCPLVFADEEVEKKGNGSELSSGELRRIIGNPGRTLTRKNIPNSDLVGNLRLYFAANNDKMLQRLGHEEASIDDVKAVQLRFLYIDARELKGKRAVDMLASLRASGELNKWANEGTYLAQHLVWLKQNRVVVPGARFLVEGDDPHVADKLTGYTTTVKYVLEWIISHLVRDRSIKMSHDPLDKLIRVGDGEVLINTYAIAHGDNWDRYLKNYRRARMSDIGKALGTLSRRQMRRVDNYRWHVIEVQKILDWCEEAQLADPVDIQKIIMQPLTVGAQGTILEFPKKQESGVFSFGDDEK